MSVTWRKDKGLMKRALKSFIYRSGLHRLHHRARNRAALTVVSFHRVLDPADRRYPGAHPNYTVTVQEFERCLRFFGDYYSVVSLDDVRNAAAGGRLPDNPLLITFDDGWRDNLDYAAPALCKFGFPAVLFVATGFINSEFGFWQEEIFDRVARSTLSRDEIWYQLGFKAPAPRLDLPAFGDVCIRQLADKTAVERTEALARLPASGAKLPARMLSAADLALLHDAGIAIAAHGHTHEPLTQALDPKGELEASHSALLKLPFSAAKDTMSFPHGRYGLELLRTARRVGFQHVFTSDSRLTPVDMLKTRPPLGRAEINMEMLREEADYALEESLAFWLFTQPIMGDPRA